VPNGAGPVDDESADDERKLPVNDLDIDDGETNDSEETVDRDLDEGDSVNQNLNE
jgi:hypothetical protein